MKYEIDINDDLFDELLLQRLMNDYWMLTSDLKNNPHETDMSWMTAAKNALETIIIVYYTNPSAREKFLQEIANGS